MNVRYITMLLVLLGWILTPKMYAQSFTVDDLNYSINSDSVSVTLTGHVDGINATGSLTIPESVTYEEAEYIVTNIGDYAFGGCIGLTGDLIIPNSVTIVGSSAFYGCNGFNGSLVIPNSVTKIWNDAFYNCYGFTGTLNIPDFVTFIGDNAFKGCNGFTDVIFNAINCADAQSYGPPFEGCEGTLTIGSKVERLPANMFSGCHGFVGNLVIPNSVTSIGERVLSDCYNFTGSLIIPDSVALIGAYAFSGCSGITDVVFNAINCEGYNISSTPDSSPFYYCGNSLIIGNNVQKIPAKMFKQCSNFTDSLIIPNSVTSIGANAFYGCIGFTEIIYNATNCADVNSYSYSFAGCTSTLKIGDSVERIPSYMFYDCSGFNGSLTIPSSVTSIGSYAFCGCNGFEEIVYNANCADGDNSSYSFSGCTSMLTIGNGVERIPSYMFSGCSGFKGSLTIPSSVTSIGANAFYGCNGFNGSLTIPGSVTSIDANAFKGCNGFKGSLTIPSSVTSIGTNAFYGCNGFEKIVYNAANCDDVTYYSSYSSPFYGCECELIIGDNVEKIPSIMFYNCSGLIGTLSIPNSVTAIGYYAFRNCSGFSEIIYNAINCADVDNYNLAFQGIQGKLFIGADVVRVPAYMFYNSNGITSISCLSENPSTVGNNAFLNVNLDIPVIVPCGKKEIYQNSTDWSQFINICDGCTYNVSVISNPIEGGSITGSGTFVGGEMCKLVAEPNESYAFMYWMNDDVVVSKNDTCIFLVKNDTEYVANFIKEDSICKIIFDLKDSYGDGWTGNYLVVTDEYGYSQQFTIDNGSTNTYYDMFTNGSNITLSWIKGNYTYDCSFTISYENGVVIYEGNNPTSSFSYSFNVNCEQANIVYYNVSATTNPLEGGTITGTGIFEEGDTCVLTANANDFYQFVNWTTYGDTVSDNHVLDFIVTENTDYVANFSSLISHDENEIVYVKPYSCGLNDGSSWDNATDNLNLALQYCSSQTNKPIIWVASGTYYGDSISNHNAFTMADGVNVYGGFVGNEPADYDLSLRDFEANVTILDGQSIQRVLYQPTEFMTLTVWDGFTIRNGYLFGDDENINYHGAGAYLLSNSCLNNCKIINNKICCYQHITCSGAGAYVYGSTITDCFIDGNSIIIDHNPNYQYYTVQRGCGLNASYNSTINNCIISNNFSLFINQTVGSTSGDGVYCRYSHFNNCIIANNGQGVCCNNTVFNNCDIVNNDKSGIYFEGTSNTFKNCIIWGNRNSSNTPNNITGNTNSAEFTYCAVEGGFPGEGNIDLSSENMGDGYFNPRFVNPSPTAGVIANYGDYSWELQEGSICINRGNVSGLELPEYDLAGNQRVQQGIIDIGCYESPYQGIEIPTYDNGIVYVTQTGAGSKNGTSWANALDDINYAQSLASLCSVQKVWIAAGIYYGDSIVGHDAFTMFDGINVYGGFVGNEPVDYDLSLRDFSNNPTILDGQNVQCVLSQTDVTNDTIVWDGFTIQNGYYNGRGGGVYIYGGAKLFNFIIKSNNASNGSGGIYLNGGEMHNSIIENNHARFGGGMQCFNSIITNCIFKNNTSTTSGAAAYVWSGEYRNCLFIHNSNTDIYGGAIYSDARQSYGYDGGTFINCDILNNMSSGYSAIYNSEGGGLYSNCIIWGNVSRNSGYSQINEDGTLSYCAIEGGYEGVGNINLACDNDGSVDTLNYVRFINVENNNFQHRSSSVCINAGNPYYSPIDNTDLVGNLRIFGERIDIGCYEFDGSNIIWNHISDDICHSNAYTENGFNIINPKVGENLYTQELQSSKGYDSIVNLTLMVYPNYYVEIDTILCNQTSFLWNTNTYTESGIYYDTLQTIHGCDSIYALSLEFFNTPLGEFTYMSPTNNYPFTSLPITFTWDAVEGADHYDLYVWDEDEQMPNEPYVSNLTGRSYSTTALLNYHTYNWFVMARNTCHEISSSVKSFNINIEPTLNVNLNQIDFGEIALNQSISTTLNVTGVVLENTLDVQITGDDATMFSFTKTSGWNDYTGGILIVTFNPTVVQYSYDANIVITSGTLEQTVSLTGGLADMFVFDTYVNQDVYAMNNPIQIYGSVKDLNNEPVADAEVEIGVFVMGMKRTLQTITDGNGQFSVVFEPMPTESGYYTVNSGRIGNHNTAVHDDFNIPGMTLVSSDYNLCVVTQDQPHTDSILIRNKSNLPLNNITVSTTTAPDGASFSFMPLNLGGMEEGYLIYSANGSTLTEGSYYQEAKLNATSSEGASLNFSIWYYCMEPRGVLDVMPKSLATTMTKGKSKIVDVMLTNNGTAETGDIYIDLPDVEWMSVVGNDTLSSIAVNDTAYFSLRFSPGNDIQLTQYYGTIAINSERGDDVALPYTITAVSDSTGTLMIDVTDDFTWNTNNGNGPHLEGAEVTLKGYYSLETVASGYTDADGHFSVIDLPEGYYRLSVTAEHHTDYNSVVFVEAGQTDRTLTNVYLQYQAITYSWNVEPTEIEDEYTYELIVDFETNVPVPVITIEHSGIHDLEYGESANFSLIITNHGLISAFDTHIYFNVSDDYVFLPLFDVIDTLVAQTTYIVPGTYCRTNNRMINSRDKCDNYCSTISVYYCNNNGTWTSIIQNRSLPFPIGNYTICSPNYNDDGTYIPNGNGNFGWHFPTHGNNNGNGNGTPNTGHQVCKPCVDALIDATASCVSHYVPAGCNVTSAIANLIKGYMHNQLYDVVLQNIMLDQVNCYIDDKISQLTDPLINSATGGVSGIVSCLKDFCTELMNCIKIEIHSQIANHSRGNLDNIQNTIDGLYYSTLYFSNELEFVKSFFPGDTWDTEENISEFFSQFRSLINSTTGLVPESTAVSFASSFVGTSITYDDIINFVNRWNRSVEYWSNGYLMTTDLPVGYDTEFIQIDTSMINYMTEIEDYYASIGYESIQELYEESVQNAMVIAENASQSSVCAKVTVKLSQKMTMTREAFEGTLSIHNGHPTDPMEAIDVNFIIKDSEGNDCTNLFQINTLSLNNITSIDGSGLIDGGINGVAKIQFIPTKQAAPLEATEYYFGGSLSFIDPYTAEEILYDFYPVEITVNPSPDLYVDYFMQRDILGDDALTLDKVEPSIPAELGVIIDNKGAGIAKNVTLETAEPEIIDNEKGLAIDFAMYGASFNGSPRQLGLMEIPFGNIESGHTAVGEWLFTSSLLGHFVSYEAHVIHNSSYGNQDLSLVSSLKIHELIHPIYAYGNFDDGINDFLVNDVMDAYDMPDSIYFSQGGKTAVGIVDDISYNHVVTALDTIVTLTINPSRIGWNYGVTNDPGADKYDIVSCTRNIDNQEIPLSNVWQTFVTIPDGGDPVYENKLHIVDTLSDDVQNVTYTLVYSLKTNLLDVVEITGIPDSFIDYPLESFNVIFNEAIIDSTFTYEDMTLKCQNGPNLMDESVVVNKVNDTIYNVNISTLTNESGLYVLNVNSLNISDARGYGGYNGKQATWVQYLCPSDNDSTLVAEITEGEDYTLNGFNIIAPAIGVFYDTLELTTNQDCDSIVYLELTVNPDYINSMTLTDNLVAGWNWWSTGIEQDGIDGLTMLENSLGDNGEIIKSQTSSVSYYYYMGEVYWYGGLTSINNENCYLVKVLDDGTVEMTGPRANPANHNLTITNNWNWIGYPVSMTQSVGVALSGFTPANEDIIKSQDASSTYYEGYGWYPENFNLTPGKGYLYKSQANENKPLTYTVNRHIAPASEDQPTLLTSNRHGHANNLTVIASVYADDVRLTGDNIELYAFVGDEPRGGVQLKYFEPYDCYYAVLTVTGEDGDVIHFGIVDRDTDDIRYDSNNVIVFETDAVHGTIDRPYEVSFGLDNVSEHEYNVSFYPNPIDKNTSFKIDIPLSETVKEVIVTDILGNTIRHEKGDSRTISGFGVRGVYDIRVETQSGHIYHGRIIVK